MKKYHLLYSLVLWFHPSLQAQTQVDLKTQSKSVDLSGAPFTIPIKTGTVLPSTCTVGALFFKSNAPLGQNIFGCAPANTWTLQAGATLASTTNLLSGDNQGNGVNSGIAAASVVTLTGAQTLTNKTISASQISGLAASATTDTTNATNIVTGILSPAIIPGPTTTSLGGVQAISPVSHNFLTGISTQGVPAAAQPSTTDIAGYVAPVNSDWNASTGLAQILNKPNFITAAQAPVQSVAGKTGAVTLATTDISGYVAPANPDWSATSGASQILHKPTSLSAFTNDPNFLTASSATTLPLSGDASGTLSANTVSKVNGATLPPSQSCLGTNTNSQIVAGSCGTGGGATISAVTNLIAGSGSGNGVDSGISPASVVTLAGSQTLTNKNIAAAQITGVLGTSSGGTGTTTPSLVAGSNVTVSGTWPNQTITASATAASAFSALTGSTNTSAAMTVGSGASMATSGTGSIAATSVPASGVTGVLAVSNGGTGTSAGIPVQSVAGKTGAVALFTTDISGYVAPVNADWNATTGLATILNKPNVSNAATVNSGSIPASQPCVGSNASSQIVAGPCLSPANNLSDVASASTARTNLGLGTAATQAATAFDASGAAAAAQTSSLQKASNLSDLANSSTARTNLGLGTAATQASTAFDASGAATAAQTSSLQKASNLSDLANSSTARTNLGLGTAATQAATAFDASGAAAAAQASGLQKASNLSDLASPATARTNLGLTSAATATLPLSVANGGTGTAAASLVGGSNITITGTWPNQTVTAAAPTVASTTNLLAGDNSGNAASSGIAPASVVTLNGVQTLTNKAISAGQVTGLSPSATLDATNAANITAGTLPAARLPNPTATTLGGTQSIAAVAHSFLTGITAAGVPSAAQPSFNDISGVVSIASGGTGTATPSIVAGSNVTVSGTWPNQTISASGGGSGSGSGLNPPASGSGILKGAPGSFTTTVASAGIDFQSPTSISAANFGNGTTNGIQSAVTACSTAISCSVVAPPSYGASETRPCVWGNIGQPQTTNGCAYTMSPNVSFFDFRNGIYSQNVDSGGLYPASNYQAWQRLDFITTAPLALNNPGLYFTSKVTSNVNLLALGGGVNINTGTYPNKAFYVANDTRIHGYTPGQKIGYQSFVNSYANGDALAFYGINMCYGGFSAGSDEGCEAMDIQATQGTVEYTGTVSGSASNQVTVSVNAGDGTQGEGRFLVDVSQAYTTGTISAIGTSGPITLTGNGTAWPVSTVDTTTSSAIAAPGSATVSVASVSGITTSTTLCVADPYEIEQVVPTAVSDSGFTAAFRYPHTSGAFVSAGGLACHYIALSADIATAATFNALAYNLQNSLHWVVPIIRSTSANSLMLWLQSPNVGWVGYRGRWTAANSSYAIYPGAQVTSVMQNQQLSSTLTLEAPVSFTNGDTVILPLYHNLNVYEALHSVQRVFPQVGGGNPAAWWMQLAGLWTDTDTAMEVDNNTPSSVYAGGKSKPLFMHPRGSWDSLLYLDAQPSNVIRSEDTTLATNVVLQGSNLGYAYLASDPLNHRWAMGNYFNTSYILFDWTAGNITTTGKIFASAYVTTEIETGQTVNTDLAGFITLSSGTGTYSFTGGYANAPVCTANDNTAVAAVRVQTTSSTLTVSGTGSDLVSYVCVARY